jgi:hypothetical protein
MSTINESSHETYRKTAIIVGVLFIIATVFLFIGGAVYNPILESADYLENAYPNRIIVTIGILLEFACVISMPLIPVFLFPILRKYNEPLALGYVGFRLFEAILFVLVDINKLSLINVSQGYLNNGGIDASFFQNLGSSIQAENLWGFSIYVLVFAIGSLMFNFVLYKSNLIPRFLSAWGLIGAGIILIGTALIMLEMFAGVPEAIIFLPIALQEMVFAVWLIVKGFNLSAIASETVK